jgi:hypothetical protein
MQFYTDDEPHDELSAEELRSLPVPALERVLSARARRDRIEAIDALDQLLRRLDQRAFTACESHFIDDLRRRVKAAVDVEHGHLPAVVGALLKALAWIELIGVADDRLEA